MTPPAKKTAAKKAPAKANGRTTPKKEPSLPTIKPSRFASFVSASDEWEGEPIGFDLDGKVWLCHSDPNSKIVKYLRHPNGVSVLDFISECVLDRAGWEAYIEDHAVPGRLLSGISGFLMRTYMGIEPGK